MATALHIANLGGLIRWELDPVDRRQVERLLFLTPEMERWMRDVLPLEPADRGRDISPIEQVVSVFDQIAGDPAFRGVGDFVRLHPQYQGVYEVKVTDVRVFGWFPACRNFIACSGEMKRRTKGNFRLVREHVRAAIRCRERLHLDEPKFVMGALHEIL